MSSNQLSFGDIGGYGLRARIKPGDQARLSPLELLYLAAVFFPYVGPVPFKSDVQPYAVLLATLVLFSGYEVRVPRVVCLLLIPVAAAAALVILDEFSFYSIRALIGYWSLFAHASAGYLICRRNSQAIIRWMLAAVIIWLLVAVAQQLISPGITRMLIPNVSVDYGRGMSSLATEPSFYGLFCFFLLLLGSAMAWEPWLFRALILAQVILLARSAMGILALLILISARALTSFRPVHIFILSAFVGGAILAVHEVSAGVNIRAVFLLITTLTNPSALLTGDTSINVRVDHMIYSVQGFLSSFGAPHGFDAFSAYIHHLMANDPNVIWLGEDPKGMRIMSGYGGTLFELGWFALPIPLFLTMCVWKRFRLERRQFWTYAITLNAVMFSAIQISLPLVGFLAGVCLARGREIVPILNAAGDPIAMHRFEMPTDPLP